MIPPDDDDRDDPLADLLAAADDGAPPPDPAFLAQLRETSTAAFVAAGPPPTTPAPPRRPKMLTALLKVSAAAVAAAVALAVGWQFRPAAPAAPSPLVEALDRTADADGLHLSVTGTGRAGEVWVARPNKLRWDEGAGKYQIALGDRTYRVEEAANRVTPGVAAYFRPDRPGVNLFALLDLPSPKPDELRAAKPTPVESDGTAYDRYRFDLTDRAGTARVVEVDVAGGDLHAVRTLAFDRSGGLHVIANLVVLAVNLPVPDEKFEVKNTLAEDGRVGKVADVQGVVSLKPAAGKRWTPVRPNVLLLPGDWVRADLRGANAATLRLLPRASVVIGPGALVEVVKPDQLRLHEGEVEVTPAKNTPIELLGPGGQKIVVKEREHYRIQNEKFVKVAKQPLWLKGFLGTTADESIGSLVATVDGRNVPLTVGYHKVSVDIRDQIARTTIEESFVNHTDGQLEGVFHFPLPQDASIAGFAMWIGNEQVEADVVEKQRAREIYEEIKRERRDPGLLEWTGGNIFKARVWPIFAHSEKRIKITYTQVLPLVGTKYRYSYALQSEMLQQHPLKELSLDVRVSSTAPIKSVSSPTHMVRADHTDHAGRLEFAAQEYTPTRDFEAVVELADSAPRVAVVPHRRGTDGYFLVQVTPPAGPARDRDLVADGGPLQLLLVCDTSASIGPGQRTAQLAVATALLEALTPADTVNLAVCDAATDWAFGRPVAATPENVRTARTFLAGRPSLGWTDLDRAFAAALKQAGPKAQVVYLGDGIVTTGDANPQAFADRLRAAYQASGSTATLHAVALGSAFEPPVLKAVGSLGGGSVRRVTGEQGPVAVALELLGEITRPAVRDVKVAFPGWKTASVYPDILPNLVPGTQQILIGRYLPEGKDQAGEVVVTGVQGDQAVRYSARAVLPDGDAGNSFLPRLWARMHLDKLLEKPQTHAVKDDVIALSEEFGIITPYTSFLVLETDADRARFKVKRRFQMRDGELFFAEGRGNAEYELARQQMKRAADWRTGLRRQVLATFGRLGRGPLPAGFAPPEMYSRSSGGGGFGGGGFSGQGMATRDALVRAGGGNSLEFDAFDARGDRAELGDESRQNLWGLDRGLDSAIPAVAEDSKFAAAGPAADAPENAPLAAEPAHQPELGDGLEELAKRAEDGADKQEAAGAVREDIDFDAVLPAGRPMDALGRSRGTGLEAEQLMAFDGEYGALALSAGIDSRAAKAKFAYLSNGLGLGYHYRGGRHGYLPARWFDGLFPPLPAAPATPAASKNTNWPKEARDLARLVLRRDALAKLPGGLKIMRKTDSFDAPTGDLSGREDRLELYSPKSWATRTEHGAAQTVVEWCDGTDRGSFYAGFRLGRTRAAVPADLKEPPLAVPDYSLTPLDETFAYLPARVVKTDAGVVLVLKRPDQAADLRVTIDTGKRVVTRFEQFNDGQPTTVTTFGDFTEVGGSWWPRRVETVTQGKRTTLVTQAVTALPADDFAAQVQQTLAGRDTVPFLRSPEPKVLGAKKAVVADKAGIADRFALLNYYAGFQQWTRAAEQLDALDKLAAGKPGVRWLRTVFLVASRRGEDLRTRLLAEAAAAAKLPASGDRVALADFVYQQGQQLLAANELLMLLDRLRPAYAHLPKSYAAAKQWRQARVNALANAGKPDESRAAAAELAADYPHDFSVQYQYAQAVQQRGDVAAAFALVEKHLAADAGWEAGERDAFRLLQTRWLEEQGRYPELVAVLAAWVKLDPESAAPYQQYLSALVYSGQQAKADDLIGRWLAAAQVKGEVSPAVRARFQAAVSAAVGRGHNLYTDRIDPKWLTPLADAARFLLGDPDKYQLADAVLNGGTFPQTDDGQKVRADLLDRLRKHVADWPLPRLTHGLTAIVNSPTEKGPAVWAKLAAGLEARWAAEPDAERKHQLGQATAQLLTLRLGGTEYRAFLRRERKDGPATHRPEYTAQLFDSLLSTAWTEAVEAEAVALLPELGDPDQPDARPFAQVAAVYRLTDRMPAARFEAEVAKIYHPEKLTRTELAKKRADLLKTARTAFADRLGKAALPADLKPWAAADRLYLLAKVDADPKALAADVWTFLGDAPKAEPKDHEPTAARHLEGVLRDRYLALALYLAARKGAPADQVDRMLKYLDAGIAADPTEPGWKAAKFQLLVALDRPKDLEAALAAWVAANDADGRWRTALGYVLAELGRLPEAIALFEAVEKTDELGAAGHRALAGWYMAVNKRAAHERELLAAFKEVDENTLGRLLQARLNPWQRGGGHLPSELDPDVLRLFAAVFEKSSYPQNYLSYLQQYYQACHDFRLLAVAADAVVGQSAGKVYPFLQGMQNVLNEVRDEATGDELLGRIDTLRKSAKTPTDQRALDLLELQVRRRAAEVQNQPGPHAEKALAAMKRAFDRPWAAGEPVLMSGLLRGLGAIARKELADEQLRELRDLHAAAGPGTFDRLQTADDYATVLGYYGRQADGIAVLRAALDGWAAAHDGAATAEANTAVNTLVSLHEALRRPAGAEAYLQGLLRKPANGQQALWLALRLDELYSRTLQNDTAVSLGTGAALYRAIEQRLIREIDAPDPNHRYQVVNLLCGVYRTAKAKGFPTAAADVTAFADATLPPLLAKYPANYTSVVSDVGRAVHDVAGPAAAVGFLVSQLEREPAWLRLNDQDGWNRSGWELAQWRAEAKVLPAGVEARLLKLVLAELRADLRTRQPRQRVMFYANHSYYWAEKEADFAAAADDVAAEVKTSGPGVQYVAEYLFRGCNRPDRAIEVLFAAHGRKILDDGGQVQLVRYLHDRGRFGESVALLVPLVGRSPDAVEYRTLLCTAYFKTGKADELAATFAAAEKHFRDPARWTEANMAALAENAVQCHLYARGVAVGTELVSVTQRTHPRRGIGDGALSRYYGWLADAHAGLGQTLEAVDAASGAVVSWGANINGRTEAVNALTRVLAAAPDLDKFVGQLDARTADTGLLNPVVRKAVGQTYLARAKYPQAAAQLQLALNAQPNDAETLRLLIDCYDKLKDPEGAAAQVLRSLDLNRRDIKRYENLGDRYLAMGRPTDAERAYTSVVEALPNEAEGHQLLAEIRQRQGRSADAIPQWEEVARVRSLEPTGLLGLAAAQVHERQFDRAAATVAKLRARAWPPHFGDINSRIAELERQLRDGQR